MGHLLKHFSVAFHNDLKMCSYLKFPILEIQVKIAVIWARIERGLRGFLWNLDSLRSATLCTPEMFQCSASSRKSGKPQGECRPLHVQVSLDLSPEHQAGQRFLDDPGQDMQQRCLSQAQQNNTNRSASLKPPLMCRMWRGGLHFIYYRYWKIFRKWFLAYLYTAFLSFQIRFESLFFFRQDGCK